MIFFNRKWLSFLVIFMLLFLNTSLLFRISTLNKSHKEIQHSIKDFEINTRVYENIKMDAFQLNFETSHFNGNLCIDNVTIQDSLKKEIKIEELFGENRDRMIICRFSELHCQECVIYSIVKLIEFSEKITKDNILFLGAYDDNRSFNIFRKQLGIHFMKAYNVLQLDIPIEDLGVPYFFILDRSLKVSNVFVPEKLTPELTNQYLEIINERYFKLE